MAGNLRWCSCNHKVSGYRSPVAFAIFRQAHEKQPMLLFRPRNSFTTLGILAFDLLLQLGDRECFTWHRVRGHLYFSHLNIAYIFLEIAETTDDGGEVLARKDSRALFEAVWMVPKLC